MKESLIPLLLLLVGCGAIVARAFRERGDESGAEGENTSHDIQVHPDRLGGAQVEGKDPAHD